MARFYVIASMTLPNVLTASPRPRAPCLPVDEGAHRVQGGLAERCHGRDGGVPATCAGASADDGDGSYPPNQRGGCQKGVLDHG